MQTCVQILKFMFFFYFKISFHITGALHVSTDVVIIRYFEKGFGNCRTSVNEYNSEVYPRLCAHVFCMSVAYDSFSCSCFSAEVFR
jgi:hypothetical protein